MKTKFILKNKPFFYFLEKKYSRKYVFFILPSCWIDKKRMGIEIHVIRFSLGWGYYRIHLNIGQVKIFNQGSILQEEFGISEYIIWLSQFIQKKIDQSAFQNWIIQSDWKNIIRWGGLKYHYIRILIAKDFVFSQTTKKDIKKTVLDLKLDQPNDNDIPDIQIEKVKMKEK